MDIVLNTPYNDDDVEIEIVSDEEEEEVVEIGSHDNEAMTTFTSPLNIVFDKPVPVKKRETGKLFTFSQKKSLGDNVRVIQASMRPGPDKSLILPDSHPVDKLRFPTWINIYNRLGTFDHETDLIIVSDRKKLENLILYDSKDIAAKRFIMFIDPYIGFVHIYANLLWTSSFPYTSLTSFFLVLLGCKRVILYQCCMNIRYSISRICKETNLYHKMFNFVFQKKMFVPSQELLEEDYKIVTEYTGFTNITSEYLRQSVLYKDKKKVVPLDKLNQEIMNFISFDHCPSIESADMLVKTLFSEVRGKNTFRILDLLSPLKRVFPLIPISVIIDRLEFVLTNFSKGSEFMLFDFSGTKGSWDEDIGVTDKLEYYYSQTIIIPLENYTLHLSWLDLNLFMRKNPYMFNLENYKETVANMGGASPKAEHLLYNIVAGTHVLNKKNQIVWRKKAGSPVFSRYPAYNIFEWVTLMRNKTFLKKSIPEEITCTPNKSIKEYRKFPNPVYGKEWIVDVKNLFALIEEFKYLIYNIPSILDGVDDVDDSESSGILKALLPYIREIGGKILEDGVFKHLGKEGIEKLKNYESHRDALELLFK